MDIGTSGGTEYDVEPFNKAVAATVQWLIDNYSDKLDDIYCGNIHSHHTMEAYFSGTDVTALCDNAPTEGFWPSLVVSSSANNNLAFGFSYRDQHDHPIYYTWKKEEVELSDTNEFDEAFEAELAEFSTRRVYSYTQSYKNKNTSYTGGQRKSLQQALLEELEDPDLGSVVKFTPDAHETTFTKISKAISGILRGKQISSFTRNHLEGALFDFVVGRTEKMQFASALRSRISFMLDAEEIIKAIMNNGFTLRKEYEAKLN